MPIAKDTVKSSSRKPTLPPTSETKAAGSIVTKKSVEPKTPKKSIAATPYKDTSKQPTMTAEERYRMIAVVAYYRAEKRGFIGGDPAQDWVDAEAEVEKLIGK